MFFDLSPLLYRKSVPFRIHPLVRSLHACETPDAEPCRPEPCRHRRCAWECRRPAVRPAKVPPASGWKQEGLSWCNHNHPLNGRFGQTLSGHPSSGRPRKRTSREGPPHLCFANPLFGDSFCILSCTRSMFCEGFFFMLSSTGGITPVRRTMR